MASAAQSLRLCFRSCRTRPAMLQRPVARSSLITRRPLSQSPRCYRQPNEKDDDESAASAGDDSEELDALSQSLTIEQAAEKALEGEDRSGVGRMPRGQQLDGLRKALGESKTLMSDLKRRPKVSKQSWWHEEEADTELLTDEQNEDEFEEDDILSLAHAKLEEHREWREYARLLVYDLPLLAKHAKAFEPPEADEILRFRYTSYMGEFHPAEKKVVVDFCPADLGLTPMQQDKLKKLAGARYNPEKDVVHMSCELFEHQAQNKRYLGDLVNKLVAEAKDPKDTFEDLPLDTRHHTFKTKPKFPKEWRMTEERRKELQQVRQQSFLLDEAKKAEGTLVNGSERIRLALEPPQSSVSGRVAELVAAAPLQGRPPSQRQPGRR